MSPRYPWTGQYEMVRFNHYLPRHAVEHLTALAKTRGVSRSELLRQALTEWLARAERCSPDG